MPKPKNSTFKAAPGKKYSDTGVKSPSGKSVSSFHSMRTNNSYGNRKAVCKIK